MVLKFSSQTKRHTPWFFFSILQASLIYIKKGQGILFNSISSRIHSVNSINMFSANPETAHLYLQIHDAQRFLLASKIGYFIHAMLLFSTKCKFQLHVDFIKIAFLQKDLHSIWKLILFIYYLFIYVQFLVIQNKGMPLCLLFF